LNGLGGDDVIDATSLEADGIQLTMNGGLGNDLLLGSQGDDVFVWNPGDDNDIIEGGDGSDRMLFNGAPIAEQIDIAALGERVRFTRDVATVVMDLGGIEAIDFNAKGGADNIVIHDLSGTNVTEINLNLEGTPGAGDNSVDTVTVFGTGGDDVVLVTGDA